ncbi:MAG: hypothetical protein IKM18_06885, partial [Clostridia bacterium]|nr:hypothetical protein [Clostridia bacterium]
MEKVSKNFKNFSKTRKTKIKGVQTCQAMRSIGLGSALRTRQSLCLWNPLRNFLKKVSKNFKNFS